MARMGRPRLPESLRKTKQVLVVLTVSEHEALVNLAESTGKSMSGMARELVVDCLSKEGVVNG